MGSQPAMTLLHAAAYARIPVSAFDDEHRVGQQQATSPPVPARGVEILHALLAARLCGPCQTAALHFQPVVLRMVDQQVLKALLAQLALLVMPLARQMVEGRVLKALLVQLASLAWPLPNS